MKSIFNNTVREELIGRIHSLNNEHQSRWGKMNVYQMVRHCQLCDDMFSGEIKIKRVFIGRLIGPMILKKALKDDKPFGRNSPTSPLLKTTAESGDLEEQKKEWAKKVEAYADYNNNGFIHPFFGPMTQEQVGLFAYKHADHHLQQFGV